MLESVNPDLVAHQGSPTKHPARRLETIRAAGELRIPFTSGILVGIGETEDERVAALEALAAVHAEHGHLQEVILQNFVPHEQLLRPRAGRHRRRGGAAALGDRDRATRPRRATVELPAWATPVSIDEMKRLVAECRRLMPDVGVQVPPNLADWWPELVARGRDRPRRPERQRRPHLARAPVPVAARGPQAARRRRRRADRAAVRLPALHRPGVDRAGRARRRSRRATGASSRAAAAAAPSRRGRCGPTSSRAPSRARATARC